MIMIYSKFSKIMMNNYGIINFNILQYNDQLTLSPLVLLFTNPAHGIYEDHTSSVETSITWS